MAAGLSVCFRSRPCETTPRRRTGDLKVGARREMGAEATERGEFTVQHSLARFNDFFSLAARKVRLASPVDQPRKCVKTYGEATSGAGFC